MSGDGRHGGLGHDQRRARRPEADARLTRAGSDRILGGVAAGIAAFVGASPAAVRAIFVVAVPLTGGIAVVLYLLLWLLLPGA